MLEEQWRSICGIEKLPSVEDVEDRCPLWTCAVHDERTHQWSVLMITVKSRQHDYFVIIDSFIIRPITKNTWRQCRHDVLTPGPHDM